MNFDDDLQPQLENADKQRPVVEAAEHLFSSEPGVWQEGYPYRAKRDLKTYEHRTRLAMLETDPVRWWKLSLTDSVSRDTCDEYTQAKGALFSMPVARRCHGRCEKSNHQRRARIESIRHVLNLLPYPGKNTFLRYPPDPLMCAPASVLSEDGNALAVAVPR